MKTPHDDPAADRDKYGTLRPPIGQWPRSKPRKRVCLSPKAGLFTGDLRCPKCEEVASKVVDTRGNSHGIVIRRRRECLKCSARFTSYESTEHPVVAARRAEAAIVRISALVEQLKAELAAIPVLRGDREAQSVNAGCVESE